ncbi:MAG: bifunctional hydroxymethylpyrimidine kinase/phosphomethylpyrimidine kinase [Thermoplasmata archaeon HGW-Thermoplasmata-1]|nr:MAG: bifunctional hydroxymethylpyrimidine kinase/phosphomethylpyrimidine kinase [Thermoplasmata archaeon HGW-Thermoplasmata-1]
MNKIVERKRVAVSIAGHDPSGGAGIDADVAAFLACGVHPATVLTCATVQNTLGVSGIFELPKEIVERQIDALAADFEICAAKTGMLHSPKMVKLVARKAAKLGLTLVVDPVLAATTGASLSGCGSYALAKAIAEELLPHAYLVTPNVPEAESLCGIAIRCEDDIREACRKLHGLGARNVLIKGGHFGGGDESTAQDTLFDGREFYTFTLPRIKDKKAHGSGCTLSALITGYLARGMVLKEAVSLSKRVLWSMIKNGYAPGKGVDVLNHSDCGGLFLPPASVLLECGSKRFCAWDELSQAAARLLRSLRAELVAEVGMNFAYALNGAAGHRDVCALNGRISVSRCEEGCASFYGGADFGASKHVASIALAAMAREPDKRCALNVRYGEKNLEACKKAGLSIGNFNRKEQPKDADSSMEWGTADACGRLGFVPDVIWDAGDDGKEPMIRLIGKNPADVLSKLESIIKSRF